MNDNRLILKVHPGFNPGFFMFTTVQFLRTVPKREGIDPKR